MQSTPYHQSRNPRARPIGTATAHLTATYLKTSGIAITHIVLHTTQLAYNTVSSSSLGRMIAPCPSPEGAGQVGQSTANVVLQDLLS